VKLTHAIAASLMFALPACSSSTDAPHDTTADGFKVSISVSPESPVVGQMVTATMTVENTTSATLSRSFPVNNLGPQIKILGGAIEGGFNIGGFFGDGIELGAQDTLIVAPHSSASAGWNFFAISAGSSTLVGCFPENDNVLQPEACASKAVKVVARQP
jgi:hypothetical protein